MKQVIRGWYFLVLGNRDRSLLFFSCHFGVIWMLCYVSLPRGAMKWSTVFYHLLTFTMCHQQLASNDTSALTEYYILT